VHVFGHLEQYVPSYKNEAPFIFPRQQYNMNVAVVDVSEHAFG